MTAHELAVREGVEEGMVSSYGRAVSPVSDGEQVPSSRRSSIENHDLQLQLEKTASMLPPPNGGVTAWLQVLASFCVFFSTWGIVNTFGVFQTTYSERILASQSNSDISWIGSLQGFLLLSLSLVAGPLFDKGYCNVLLYAGTFLIVLGMMMTSLCTQYWQFLLAQGICMGVGNGFLFIPCVAIIPAYFTTKRGIATGIAASGSSLGGVIYPIVFRQLEPRIGFPWTTRVMAFIMLSTMLLTITVTKVREMPAKARPMIDLQAFKSRPYSIYCVACLFGFAGVYVPFFYAQKYAVSKAGTGENLSFYSLSLMNGASIFGRVLPGLMADHIGTLNTLFICSAATALVGFCWAAAHTTAGILVFCAVYGFFSGTFVSLQAAVVSNMVHKLYMMGTWLGMVAFVSGLGLLMGNPVAGAILAQGSWLGAQLYCGVAVTIATVLVLAARVSKVGWKLTAIG